MSNTMTTPCEKCACGHPWSHHGLVKGREPSPGVVTTDEAGDVLTFPDVWVCSGDDDPPYLGHDASPWDYVCGCILHTAPPLVIGSLAKLYPCKPETP